MCSDTVISLKSVGKRFVQTGSPLRHMWQVFCGSTVDSKNDFHALSDVTFSISRGETLGIVGRNGAGKSTLLQIICGVLAPSTGTVKVEGRIAALLELGAGFNPEFSGRENVYLSAAVYGLSRAETESRMDSILSFAEIGDFVDQPVKTYSSGMFVRLAFAVIVHVDAQILVIDEALAVGDFHFTQKCMRFLESFARSGTLIFVSHDTHSVVKLCKKAIWLDKGHVCGFGSARDVSDAYLGSFYENRMVTEELLSPPDGSSSISAEGFTREFGLGGGRIVSAVLSDDSGSELLVLDRSQRLSLQVECKAVVDLPRPILGFYVKDRLGQPLFGTNTLECNNGWQDISAGMSFNITFIFDVPLLASGEYSVTIALGEGTQLDHVQHHWVHDFLTFKALANPHLTGFFELQKLICDIQIIDTK